MRQPKILVTGATGKTGSAVVDELLARGVPLRAVLHRKDARSAALERKGVETVVADMFDPDQLLAAMRGTQRAYYLPVSCAFPSHQRRASQWQTSAGKWSTARYSPSTWSWNVRLLSGPWSETGHERMFPCIQEATQSMKQPNP